MFTGLIERIGTLEQIGARGNYAILKVRAKFDGGPIVMGESIACDGACLTVVEFDAETFTVEASQETAQRTILNTYKVGSRINLERALRVGDRLGGHYVLGHVDGLGKVEYLKKVGESHELAIGFDKRFGPWVIEKGSIAIDGVSLTINECSQDRLTVNLVPLTVRETRLGELTAGAPVNLEFDIIGKYVARMTATGTKETIQGAPLSGLSVDTIIKSGW